MGSGSSKPKESASVPAVAAEKTMVSKQNTPSDNKNVSTSSSGGCPVKHSSTPPSSSSGGGCPVKHSSQKQQYNVYSQPIDPTNQMPAVANQLPSPLQKESLSTERVKSTIPKGGADDGTTWTYPSPQMFYNSLVRKEKLGDTLEEDIESVVALHNNMNERTWNQVLEWERVIAPTNEEEPPKLLKFMGRPCDLSPKARIKHYLFNHPLPFDRHDWTIVRSDGSEVRYIIDYYHDETKAQEEEGSGMPSMHDYDATPSLLVDVRPALDTPTALLDRAIYMPYARRVSHSTQFQPLPMMPTAELSSQVQESVEVWNSIQKSKQQKQQSGGSSANDNTSMSEKEARAISNKFHQALVDCRALQIKLDECQNEQECARASLDLQLCMARLWCPLQHEAVVDALQKQEDENAYQERVEMALENVSTCVTNTSQRARLVQQQYPTIFQQGVTKK